MYKCQKKNTKFVFFMILKDKYFVGDPKCLELENLFWSVT